MSIGMNNIYDLIKVCQEFDTKFDGNETVELFAKALGISKISYRIFFNDVSIESAVIYHAENNSFGEEFDFKRVAVHCTCLRHSTDEGRRKRNPTDHAGTGRQKKGKTAA